MSGVPYRATAFVLGQHDPPPAKDLTQQCPTSSPMPKQIRKPAVASKGGIVAAQSRKAAEVGAAVLAAGGDCVDAVIATTFALGVAGALDERPRRRRRDGALSRARGPLRGDRLRHARAARACASRIIR